MQIETRRKRSIIAITLTCIFGWSCAFLATRIYAEYTFGLFVWLPVVMGALSTILYAYKNAVSRKNCRGLCFLTLFIFCIGLLTFAFEGIICIIMAAPIGLAFTWAGHLIGYEIIKSKIINTSLVSLLLVVSAPVVMGFEYAINTAGPNLRSVTTSIKINTKAVNVWKNVIAFPQLKKPDELIFRSGIAYPINAEIKGAGEGAVRYCNFSTGSFVEPITEWHKDSLLRFSVTEQPATMKELSLYDLHPNHLHGYFISVQGQFKLIEQKDGSTLLEGTTWYYNKIKPGVYWNIWSDYIIHKIHNRVLNHIKQEAEKSN